jgi:hypothetical protein
MHSMLAGAFHVAYLAFPHEAGRREQGSLANHLPDLGGASGALCAFAIKDGAKVADVPEIVRVDLLMTHAQTYV